PVAGTVLEILVQEDEDIEVGQVLAEVGAAAGSAADSHADDPAGEEGPAEEEPEEASESADETPEPSEPDAKDDAPASASVVAQEVSLTELGESVTDGTVTRWLNEICDIIQADEPIVEISTDNVDTEIPSPVAGTVLEIKVQEDEDIEVGQVLA